MNEQVIEAKLLEEVERLEAAGQSEQGIPVVIAHVGGGETAEGGPRNYDKLVEQVQATLQGIRDRLSELGVTGAVEQITLSNALEATLTPTQIRRIAKHGDIKRIILNREEKVIE